MLTAKFQSDHSHILFAEGKSRAGSLKDSWKSTRLAVKHTEMDFTILTRNPHTFFTRLAGSAGEELKELP